MASRNEVRSELDRLLAGLPLSRLDPDLWGSTPEAQAEADAVMRL